MNLVSLVDAKNNLKREVYEDYINLNEIKIREYEVQSIENIINIFIDSVAKDHDLVRYFDKFTVGYEIKQIGKEFDLLRLGHNYNLNIELKSEFTRNDKIIAQLKKNRYYLSPLKVPAYFITFIEDEKRFVQLHGDTLVDLEIKEVFDIICNQEVINYQSLDKYFDPSYYLVSPFNSTNEFINSEYFLTAQQDEIKKDIINNLNEPYISSIKGAPGTGKTLLIYDIAKDQMIKGKNVLIIHCGILNNGHYTLINTFGWKISGVKNFGTFLSPDLDLIVIDESQRIDINKFNTIVDFANRENIPCVFSHDGEQCLHTKEINRQMAKIIIDASHMKFSLKQKVRTNREMATFIKYFFNTNMIEPNNNTNFKDIVSTKYFKDMETAKAFVETLTRDKWTFVNFTNSLHTYDPFDSSVINNLDNNAHRVVGQEFDKVGVIINDHFLYEDGRLRGTNRSYYHSTKMLFQILTRAKKNLYLIIVNNENVLTNLFPILHDRK